MDRDFAADSVDVLNRLLELAPRDASNWVLAGEYERARENYQKALTHVDRALNLQPESPMAQWLGATLATESSDSELQLAGRQRLWSLSSRLDFVGLRALSQLAVGDLSDGQEINVLLERLSTHPMANVAHQLAGEHMRLRHAESSAAGEDIEAAVELRYGGENRSLFLAWLNRVGEFGRVMNRLSFEHAQHDRGLFLVLCESMLKSGEGKALMDILDSEETKLPIRDSTREFLTVELARKLGLDDRAERLAGMLIKRAETINPPVSVISLAQRFETKQLWDDAERTYLYLLKKFPAERGRAYDRLTHCYRQQGDSAALLALSKELRDLEPENPIYAHNWAYLALLRRHAIDEAMSVLERFSREHRLVSSVCVRAMQAARGGDAGTALGLVQPLVWESLAPLVQRWVRAVLIRSGENVPVTSLKSLNLTLFEEEKVWLDGQDTVAVTGEEESVDSVE